jgi:hypothetical protein
LRQIGVPPNTVVAKGLQNSENFPIDQIIIDGEDETLPQASLRALMTALLGIGPGMKGGPYKLLKSLRIWKSNIGDEGATAIVYSNLFTVIIVYYNYHFNRRRY